MPCNTACLLCAVNSTNCFKCAFGYYLYVPANSCLSNCPINYYNNPVITINYYYCTECTTGCLSCTGPSLNNCSSCKNDTAVNGTIISYFKDPTGTYCVLACSQGYYGNAADNNCESCQIGCVTCNYSASNCFKCQSAGGNDYFLPATSNSCVTVCPNGYYGNSTDYTCHPCIYYTLNGTCLLTCPSGTFVQMQGTHAICQSCNGTNVTGNPCNTSPTFTVQTQVINNG